MKLRRKKYADEWGGDSVLLRQRLGLGRYRKTAKRDPEERKLLLELGLKKMEEAEEADFISVGPRRRKLRLP